jgi:hypothetical protein
MKARLKVLLDELRGGAWPSPVRAVRCPVKSGNDRDPRPLLLAESDSGRRTLREPPSTRWRKERATAGQYAPNPPGHTRAAMAGTMGSHLERGR